MGYSTAIGATKTTQAYRNTARQAAGSHSKTQNREIKSLFSIQWFGLALLQVKNSTAARYSKKPHTIVVH